jgi:gliding motility-associated-like protein
MKAKLLLFLLFIPTVIFSQTTWYSYQSGNWAVGGTNWRTWTLDPSGTTLINPSMQAQPAAGENVVILNGRIVTIPTGEAAKTVASVTIQEGAVLDITTTTGHNFGGTLNGSGMLRISSADFPDFATGTFIKPGGGTVEYRNMGGFTLQQFEYNNLIINLNNNTDSVLYNNATTLVINNTATIEKGKLKIGDNASTVQRIVNFNGDVIVNQNGRIGVGVRNIGSSTSTTSGGRSHQITIKGNLYNNGGIVRFTNMTSPVYGGNPPTGTQAGWSDVIFNNGTEDQYVVCDGPTVFYRIEIAKGTDQTFILHIDADNNTRFQLMGRNERTSYNPGTPPNLPNFNALGLLSGTLRLGSNIVIPSLSTDSYVVDEDAGIWFDGSTVTMNSTTSYSALFTYGTVRFSSNCQVTLLGQIGMVLRESGNFIIESGNILTRSCRPSVLSNPDLHRGAFKMYGGTLTCGSFDTSGATTQHATFSIAYPDNVFIMTGGTIDIQTSFGGGGNANNFSLLLGCLPKNVEVTGGNIRISTTARPAYVNSTVPLPNLEVYGTGNSFQVRGVTGLTTLVNPLPLVVQKNLTLQNAVVFNNTQNVNVLVGGNFNISGGTTYTPGTNTTVFNGNGAQMLDIQGNINGNLNNLSLSNASNLTINNVSAATPVVVNANLNIDNGCTLTDNGRVLEVRGNIVNSGTQFKPVSGAGSIQLTGTGNQIISGDGTGKFNNLTLNKTGGSVTLQSNMTVTGDLRLANTMARLNIGSSNLLFTETGDVFDNLTGTGKSFGTGRMIQTAGLMSDGGVSKKYSGTSAFDFPFGFNLAGTYYFMPASIRFSSAPAVFGTLTTRPVSIRHPLAQTPNSLACYWETTSSGFSGIAAGSVIHNYTYHSASNFFVSGDESTYIPGVYRSSAGDSWTVINNPLLVNDGLNIVTFDNASEADGEYTAGEPAAFGAIPVRYSSGLNTDWDNTATWSSAAVGGPGGASVPDANTIVVIGDNTHNHSVIINQANRVCGSLTIYSGSVLDLRTFTGHNFEALPEKGITGSGTLRIAANNYFPQGDFGDFIGPTGGTVEYYTSGANVSIPTLSTGTGLVLDHYFNLKISPEAGRTITMPNSNLNIFNDLTVSGTGTGQVNTNTTAIHTIVTNHDFNVVSGIFEVQNSNIQTIRVIGNLLVNGTFRVNNGASVNHILELYNSLTGSGTFNLNPGTGRVLTYFKGTDEASIRGAAKAFYSLTVDKGTSQNPVLNVRSDISTSATFDPSVSIRNGTFRIKQSSFNLSTNRSVVIPETACLSVDSVANVTVVNNNVNDSTLFLVGKLEVLSGTLNVGNNSYNRRNCIEYSSDGLPTIVMQGGTLNVNGQIKRSSKITQGALRFIQSGGILNVYGKNQDNTRAKLEICNTGSLFDVSGGTINIIRGGGVDFGDLYIRPYTANVTAGTINLAPVTAIGNPVYNIDASCNLFNLSITGFNAANTATANIMVNPLVLKGDLMIAGNSTLTCNNRNVSVAGNFTNNGTYTTGNNITFFNGGNTQTAQFGTNTTFRKLFIDKTPGTSVTFTSAAISPVVTDTLAILNGTLTNAGTLNIVAQGNIINNGIHSSSGTGSLNIQGSANQVISGDGNGQFGNVNIMNGAANGVTLKANVTINGLLTLTTGYLYIDDNLLTLGSAATIGGTPGNAANSNWIITNGTLSDGGVRKIYPSVSPAVFEFPVGVAGKYTPVSYTVTFASASPGSITLKPVNVRIPSVTNTLSDELQYYWNVSSTAFGGLTSVQHIYNYRQGDVTGTETSYVGARYYGGAWTNYGSGVMNTTANTITLNQNYIDGEYTCGEPPNFVTKPVYYSYNLAPNITTTGADWNTSGSWSTVGHTGPAASSPPDGNPVIIAPGHRINVSTLDRSAYSIQNDGILNLNTTTGHNFGHVSGSGRIIMSNTDAGQFVFPGGEYVAFMNTTGSTIEYNGSNPISPLASISPIIKDYQNLEFTGIYSKYMSSMNIVVNGNMLITQSQLLNNVYNKTITIKGNWTDTWPNGFVPGTGLVSFSGTTQQQITSNGPESFYNLKINNPANLLLNGPVQVTNRLYLTNGNILTTDLNLLTLTNSMMNVVTGGSDASFVDGPLSKRILAGQSFNFPVGNYNSSADKPARYGNVFLSDVSATNYWVARYVNDDPNSLYDRTSLLSPITSVSDNEYWVVNRPGANSANVRLRWDANSEIASVNSTRVTEWVTPANRWEEMGAAASGNLSAGTVATTSPVTTDNYVFTLGISGVTAKIISVTPAEICNNGEVVTVRVLLTGAPMWTLSYTAGGNPYTQSGIATSTFDIQLTGADLGGPGVKTIELTAVSDATKPGTIWGSSMNVTVKPTSLPDINGTFTVGAGEVRNYLTANNAGSSYLWTWSGASGGIIASPASSSTNITITTPGAFPATYQLQVSETSSNGCIASDIQSITVVSTPSPDISPDNPNQCEGNSVNYSTPSITGHTYQWTVTGGTPASGTGNSINVTWNTPGNGSVVVTEFNGPVTGKDSINVVVDPQPLNSLVVTAPVSVCHNSPAIITVHNSQSGFNYQLREGAVNVGSAVAGTGGDIGLPSDDIVASTLFNVLVYNNGCSDQLTQTVTVDPEDPAAPAGDPTQDFCASDAPTIADLTATGTGILWYSAATGGSPLASATTLTDGYIYYASQTVTGCESTGRFAVTVSVSTVSAPIVGTITQPTCLVNTGSVALSGLPGTGTWTVTASPGGQVFTGSGTTTTVTGLTGGITYTFTVTNSLGCTSAASGNAIINAPPVPLAVGNITGESSATQCSGYDPATMTISPTGANGTYSYRWSTSTDNGTTWNLIAGANAATYNPGAITQTSWYRAEVDPTGSPDCATWTVSGNTIQITIQAALTVGNITGETSATQCSGYDPAAMTISPSGATGTYSYRWSTSTDNGTTWNLVAGANAATYNPGAIAQTTWYRAEVDPTGSPDCATWTVSGNTIQITIQAALTVGNITGESSATQCSGYDPAAMTISPSGATGTYSYRWSTSTDNGTTWNLVAGANAATYNPGSIAQTTWYRAEVDPTGSPDCASWTVSGNTIQISIQPALTVGNITGETSATQCSGYDPASMSVSPTGASGTYSYRWSTSINNGTTWNLVAGANTASYNPGAITQTTWYRAEVDPTGSPDCATWTVSGNTIQITIQPALTVGNITGESNSTQCSGYDPAAMTISPTGASGTYSYRWSTSIDNGTTWNLVAGANAATYNPGAITQTTWYRAEVDPTGSPDCATWTVSGNTIQISIQAALTVGNISGETSATQCSGYNPAAMTISPTGASGTYLYRWSTSTDNGTTWNLVAGANAATYNPGAIAQTTWYRAEVDPTGSPDCATWTVSGNTIQITIQAPLAVGNITGESNSTQCSGYDPATMTISPTGASGTYSYRWSTSIDNGTTWNLVAGANAAAYNPGTITQTTWYRAEVDPTGSPDCATWTVSGNTIQITIQAALTVGNITGETSATQCSGYDPAAMTISPSGATGTYSYRWSTSTDNGTTWNLVAGANAATYNPGAITQTTWYRAEVDPTGSPDCATWTISSNTIQITIQSALTVGNITGETSATQCSGYDPAAMTISPTGASGTYSYRWSTSTDNGTTWNLVAGANAATYNPGAITQSTWYRAEVDPTGSPDCATWTVSGNTIQITIQPALTVGNITGESNSTQCSGYDPAAMTISPSGASGTYSYRWSTSIDNGTTWNLVVGANAANYNPGAITQTTWYRAEVDPTGSPDCATWTVSGNTVQITIQAALTVGNITGETSGTHCSGYDPAAMTISPTGASGTYSYRWSTSTDNGTTWNLVAGANAATYNPGVITQTTWYRSEADPTGSPDCATWTVSGNTIQITIQPALIVGNITGESNSTQCSGYDPAAMTISPAGASGTYNYRWSTSTNGGSTWSLVAGANTASYDPGALTQTTWYRAEVDPTGSPDCATWTVSGNTIQVTIQASITVGNITGETSATQCSGYDPVAMTISPTGASGTYSYRWSTSTDNGTTWNLVAGENTDTYNPGTITQTTWYRAEVDPTGSPDCATWTVSGNTIQIVIQPALTVGNITGETSATQCPGYDPAAMTISPTGASGTYSYRWSTSTDNGTTWNLVAGATAATYNPGAITQTTWYRAEVDPTGSPDCASWTISGNTIQITIQQALTVGNITGETSATQCSGYDPAAMTISPTGASGTFNYRWSTSTDNGTTWNLVAGANAATYNPGAITQTTWYRAEVDPTGSPDCASWTVSGNTIQITIQAPLTVGNITGETNATQCSGYDPAAMTISPAGASGIYDYRWSTSTDNGTTWNLVAGENAATYNPGTITQTTWYRVEVDPTGSPDCVSWTLSGNSIQITIQPALTVGNITGEMNATQCSGYDPAAMTISPAGASGTYNYRWSTSTNGGSTWSLVTGANTASYDAGAITQTIWYRAEADPTGSLDCSSWTVSSNTIQITIQPALTVGNITGEISATQCFGYDPAAMTISPTGASGTYNYRWSSSTDSGTTWNLVAGVNAATFNPGALTQSTWFTAEVDPTGSPDCAGWTSSDNIIKFTILNNVMTPVFVAGDSSSRCEGAGTVIYTVNSDYSNAITYSLDNASVTEGNTIDSQTGEVTFAGNWTGPSIITVTAEGCGGPLTATHKVYADIPVTSAITGESQPLCSAAGENYSVELKTGSSYEWMVPAGAVITSGATGPENNSILVDFTINSGAIRVVETNSNGCKADTVSLDVELQGCNLTAEFTADDTVVCPGQTVTFTDASTGVNAFTNYTWIFGEGASPDTLTGPGPHQVTYLTSGSKTVALIISNGMADTLTKVGYITVSVPAVSITSENRCGAGSVDFLAVTTGDQVEFSIDGGSSVASKDQTVPYTYSITIPEGSSLQVWARAYNSVTGCLGTWDSSVVVNAFAVPVAGPIMAQHASDYEDGYVDVVCAGTENSGYYVNKTPGSVYTWQIPELNITISDTAAIEVDWPSASAVYHLQVTEISGDGCSSEVSDTLVRVSLPDPSLGADVSLCTGQTHLFEPDGDFIAYEWQDQSIGTSFTASATDTVTVHVTDEYGCEGYDTVIVTMHENPVVNLGPDTVLCEGNTLMLDAGDFENYEWSTGQTGNPVEIHEGAGVVSVIVTDINGCEGTDQITIRDCSPENLLVIPNAFTPNDDGHHDTWLIKNINMFPDADIQVFDRWGRRVYQSDGGSGRVWDGKGPNGKDLPVENYYYVIDLKVPGYGVLSGTVSIIR